MFFVFPKGRNFSYCLFSSWKIFSKKISQAFVMLEISSCSMSDCLLVWVEECNFHAFFNFVHPCWIEYPSLFSKCPFSEKLILCLDCFFQVSNSDICFLTSLMCPDFYSKKLMAWYLIGPIFFLVSNSDQRSANKISTMEFSRRLLILRYKGKISLSLSVPWQYVFPEISILGGKFPLNGFPHNLLLNS